MRKMKVNATVTTREGKLNIVDTADKTHADTVVGMRDEIARLQEENKTLWHGQKFIEDGIPGAMRKVASQSEAKGRREALFEAASTPDYDAGLLGDGGGGDVDWWQDYIHALLSQANSYWEDRIEALLELDKEQSTK